MQDQAFLGLEAALAIPDPGGAGVELYVATQWLHEDRKQIAACLGLPEEQVRLVLGGVGGAFGAREDISLQVHTCLLALRTRAAGAHRVQPRRELPRPRPPPPGDDLDAPPRHRRRRDRQDRGPVRARRRGLRVDVVGRAAQRASPTPRARTSAPNAVVDGCAVRTNNLPCGAMRGFGVVQACFAHESQMDKLAAACGLDPVEIRLRNAMETGDRLITGQVVESVAPVARCIRETAALPLPDEPVGGVDDGDPMRLPGGAGLHRRRRPRAARRRLGRGDQEPHVLRGLRRLLDGALPARRRRGHAEVRHVRGRPGLRHDRPADRPHGARRRRRRARADRHRRSARPARRRRRARRG